jgi:signal transduction histidine kinase
VGWVRLEQQVARFAIAREAQWLLPFIAARAIAIVIGAALVVIEGIQPDDVLMLAAAAASTVALVRSPGLRADPRVWAADFAAGLALVALSGDWRSPYYLYWLTSLALPATALSLRRAVALAAFAPLAFFAVAFGGGPSPGHLNVRSTETLAIHLSLPLLLVLALAYAAEALRQLQAERTRAERIAIETERRRIAWELHDSAKQRLHAAHLLVSSLQGRLPAEQSETITRAAVELESAASDMDTSLAELRSPLEGRPLDVALRDRARDLAAGSGATITIEGSEPLLSPLAGAHVYRIAVEAITNALRHADARRVTIMLEPREAAFALSVRDDGRGVPAAVRPGATGLLAMESRAASIGARLTVIPADPPPGTAVELVVPLTTTHGGPA